MNIKQRQPLTEQAADSMLRVHGGQGRVIRGGAAMAKGSATLHVAMARLARHSTPRRLIAGTVVP